MTKTLLTTLLLLIAGVFQIQAQVITTEPSPLYDNSENVVIYFHANQGNKALANLSASTKVYAHVGLITGSSSNDSDWKYSTNWGDNSDKYLLTYVEPNLYKLEIGNIKNFYGVISSTEIIRKLAFVFRSSSKQTEDLFVDVISTAVDLNLTCDAEGSTISERNPTVNFKFTSNKVADEMWISINGVREAEATNAKELTLSYTFLEPGSYNIYGNVKIDGKTSSKNLKLTYVNSSEIKDYPGGVPKMGAHRQEDGSVIFCLAAPLKLSCELIGSWNDYASVPEQKMYRQDYNGQRYFWVSIDGLDSTSMYFYYFIADISLKCGDPYAKLILDPSNDKYIPSSVYPDLPAYPSSKVKNVSLAVYQENINDYDWTDDNFVPAPKTDLVIYELLLRDFTGTEGKAQGNGNIKLALKKIPYLKELGINAVELLPINEFNGNISWGYNPNFYFAPDKAYGTPDDYKEFINTCHENGIAVILDLVFNQTDWQHPWYQLYSVGENPFYNADAPHAYSVLNDINQGNPLIRQQWKDVVKYWLTEYHVDGFRFDLVKGLGDNDSYSNSGDSGTNAYNASRVANMRAIQDAMNEVNPDAYFINENLAGSKEENEMAQTGMLNWANINTEGCQYAMGYSSNSGLNRMYATKDSRTWGSTVAYLESHDEERLAYKQIKNGNSTVKNDHAIAMRRLGSAAAQMILVPGAHMIWQFSEMGNAQSTKNSTGGNNTDPKIVNWNLLNDPDNAGLYKNYCELIRLRTLNPDLFTKDASFTINCAYTNWNNGRTIIASTPEKQMICAINPNVDKEITITTAFNSSSQADYAVFSKSYATNPTFNVAEGTITVPANSYVVIVNDKVSAVDEISLATDSDLYAYSGEGEIIVENAPEGFAIYDMSGTMRHSARNASSTHVPLPAGLYIVVSGSQARKLIVR